MSIQLVGYICVEYEHLALSSSWTIVIVIIVVLVILIIIILGDERS